MMGTKTMHVCSNVLGVGLELHAHGREGYACVLSSIPTFTYSDKPTYIVGTYLHRT